MVVKNTHTEESTCVAVIHTKYSPVFVGNSKRRDCMIFANTLGNPQIAECLALHIGYWFGLQGVFLVSKGTQERRVFLDTSSPSTRRATLNYEVIERCNKVILNIAYVSTSHLFCQTFHQSYTK